MVRRVDNELLDIGNGVPDRRARMLLGAIVCARVGSAVVVMYNATKTRCTFCGEECWRPAGMVPLDYITVCMTCCIEVLGPPNRR